MENLISKIHNEIDHAFLEPEFLAEKLGIELPDSDLKYFAADVIAKHYKGSMLEGLACACQSFMNARLLHRSREITPEKVLLGDYYSGLAAGFDLPANVSDILQKFADFVAEEMGMLERLPEGRPDLDRFETLFREIAEVAYE